MEIKAHLDKPFTEDQRLEFIADENHKLGYEIRETAVALEAWGPTDTEIFEQKKEAKLDENTTKAKEAVENGYVEYKDAEFETNAQTVGDLTATMLLMQATGLETYNWLSRDDKVVTLTLEDFGILGGLIAGFKNTIWSVKYLHYKGLIEQAETVAELDEIIIDYNVEIEPEEEEEPEPSEVEETEEN